MLPSLSLLSVTGVALALAKYAKTANLLGAAAVFSLTFTSATTARDDIGTKSV